LPNFKARN